MPSFSNLALQFRSQVVKLWSLRSDMSPAMAMEHIIHEAVDAGLLSEARALPGNTLTDWMKTGKCPAWAAQSALRLLLKTGWTPTSELEWAGVAAIFVRSDTVQSVEEYLYQLTQLAGGIDQLTASGWIHAAVEEKKVFVYEKKFKH